MAVVCRRKCTLMPRHQWQFVKNVVRQSSSGGGTVVRIYKKGKFRCACGATGFGNPAPESPTNLTQEFL